MKRHLLFLFVLFVAIAAQAQTPELFNYQGVARNSSGTTLPNQAISLRLNIHQGTTSGTIVFQETHAVTTNQFGLFSIQVGAGTIVSGTIGAVSWGTSSYYLETEMDPAGGNNFTAMGTSQLVSVPYALHAKTVETDNDQQNLAVSGNTLSISGGNSITLPATTDTDDQTLTLTGSTLAIDNGNSVNLGALDTDAQTLSLSSNTLGISNGNTVNLAPYLDNTDAQNISLTGSTLAITGGNSINLSAINTDAQTLSLSSNTLAISGGNSVSLAPYLDNTDAQNISLTGNTLAITGGNSINLSGINTDAQTLSVSGSTLTISGGNAVSLANVPTDTLSLIQDADRNTSINTEAFPNENRIRFRLNGTEQLVINRGTIENRNTGGSVYFGEAAGPLDDYSNNFNTGIGHYALNSVTTGGYNIAIGEASLESLVSGFDNLAIGQYALQNNTTSNNIAIGNSAMEANTTGTFNMAIGRQALVSNTTGSANIVLGSLALASNVSGSNNTAIGNNTLLQNTASENSAIGYEAMKANTTGDHNTAFGVHSMAANTTGVNNTAIGHDALRTNITGGFNVAVGMNALANNTASGNMAVGYGALFNNTTGTGNMGLGTDALDANTTGINNIGIGSSALGSNVTGGYNVGVGFGVLEFSTVSGNTGLGYFALHMNTTGTNNTVSGADAMSINTTGSNNAAYGNFSLAGNITGNSNSAFGESALRNNTASNNTGLGFHALYVNTTGTNNIAVGADALDANTSGNNNVAFGASALGSNVTGSGNVAIGQAAGANETGSNKLYIDNSNTASPLIWGDFSTDVVNINGNLGVGTTTPTQAKLVVNGSASNTLNYGFLNPAGVTGTSTGTNVYSIYASARIAATEFNAYSDARIKHVIGRSNSTADLNTLMNIRITDYTLIDTVEKGNTRYKKVIAQEVKAIYPNAVTTMTDVVPDIYQLAEIKNGYIAVANNLKAGEKVKLIFENRVALVSVIDADVNGFTVADSDEGKVFVYGREVNDFHTVDYEALGTLNISATQELFKRLVKAETALDQLKSANAGIEQRLRELESDRLRAGN